MDFISNEQEHVVTTLEETTEQSYDPFIPHVETSKVAQKLAIELDKPIMLDYYVASICGMCKINKTLKNEKILVKCKNEYTEPIIRAIEVKKSRNGRGTADLICVTECTIYIVSNMVLWPNVQFTL